MARYGHDRFDHPTIMPSELTALWRQISTLRKQSIEDRARLFDQLGVAADAQRLIAQLLDRWGDINVFEPGVFVEGIPPKTADQ